MLRKRLIFTLLAAEEKFMLSRNFSLQTTGDFEWIKDLYDFISISHSIDELVLLNVSRKVEDYSKFADLLKEVAKECFMPISAGGAIRTIADATLLLRSGADKIVLNTPFFTDQNLVRQLVEQFGSQCIIASIDYKRTGQSDTVFINNGSTEIEMTLEEAIKNAIGQGAGELYLTSIAKDGTGQGFDLEYINKVCANCPVPVIISGGAGNFEHFTAALNEDVVSAASTANLFNFMSSGLTEARNHIIQSGIPLAKWDVKTEAL